MFVYVASYLSPLERVYYQIYSQVLILNLRWWLLRSAVCVGWICILSRSIYCTTRSTKCKYWTDVPNIMAAPQSTQKFFVYARLSLFTIIVSILGANYATYPKILEFFHILFYRSDNNDNIVGRNFDKG